MLYNTKSQQHVKSSRPYHCFICKSTELHAAHLTDLLLRKICEPRVEITFPSLLFGRCSSQHKSPAPLGNILLKKKIYITTYLVLLWFPFERHWAQIPWSFLGKLIAFVDMEDFTCKPHLGCCFTGYSEICHGRFLLSLIFYCTLTLVWEGIRFESCQATDYHNSDFQRFSTVPSGVYWDNYK
jgi:hypothetical protein